MPARDGIARLDHEITEDYVKNILLKSVSQGLIIICEHSDNPDELIAEMHDYTIGIELFRHVISEVTICVHPDFQGKKIGHRMMSIFLEEIACNRPDIGKVELITREGNTRAIALYQSLGFALRAGLKCV
ncbi:MAG: GNAT family N-acetyltransferase [Sporocytophaga sp.]|uniref:GNAT family N-acetyltransferase n=1 Tax=Sporocytophaga sp. TaxID=2231183 RepID=UPI001B1B308D|nr:N-acetyltransferase [Sporocytophaga sp.]MBO9700062.1 GNAT family N-acetyltransferase [Sporocytophaga sp.]